MGLLPLPRPVTYGLATPFTHPVRTLTMLLAVAFGTVAATRAVGLTSFLTAVGTAQNPESRAAATGHDHKLNDAAPPPRKAGRGPRGCTR
jgi:putative ABC transport system permease protein